MTDVATAFVPGHLTVVFSIHRHDDPRRTGSRGAGIAVADGMTVTVESGTGTTLNGDPVTIEAVDIVFDTLDVDASVTLETSLPLGVGFGLSGAAALGSAFAANAAFDLDHTEDDLVTIAHVADVEAGTGLGDVVAQARGGIPIRVEAGAPGYGRLDGIPATGRIEYLTLGSMSTVDILEDAPETVTTAGDHAVRDILEQPTLAYLFARGRRYSAEVGFLDDDLAAIIDEVTAVGGEAAVGLLGRTIVALDDGLSRAGYDPNETSVDPAGARLLDQ